MIAVLVLVPSIEALAQYKFTMGIVGVALIQSSLAGAGLYVAGVPGADVPCPESEAAALSVLSLPMHPYLEEADQRLVIDALAAAVRSVPA